MQVDLKTLSNNFTVPHPIIFFPFSNGIELKENCSTSEDYGWTLGRETLISVPVVIRGIIQKRSRVQTSINRHFQNS